MFSQARFGAGNIQLLRYFINCCPAWKCRDSPSKFVPPSVERNTADDESFRRDPPLLRSYVVTSLAVIAERRSLDRKMAIRNSASFDKEERRKKGRKDIPNDYFQRFGITKNIRSNEIVSTKLQSSGK